MSSGARQEIVAVVENRTISVLDRFTTADLYPDKSTQMIGLFRASSGAIEASASNNRQ
jgi:hypothetical protein